MLTIIYILFGRRDFTSRELSDCIRKAIAPITKLHPYFERLNLRVSRKLISNDLRRLYGMGFLKKRRVKRKCRTKNGKICYKGYEYKYSLSSQGLKYLEYLGRGGEEEEIEEVTDLIVKVILEKKAPEEIRDILWEFYQTQVKEKKGFRRFSTSKIALWEKVLDHITEVFRDKKIKSLENRVKMLEEENEALRREIEEYRNQEFEIKVFLQKFRIQFERMELVMDELLKKMEKENEEIRRSKERYKKAIKRANKVLEEFISILPE